MESIKEFLYRFVPGPLFFIGAGVIFYEWWFKGVTWVFLGFIPVTPILIIILGAMGVFLTKLGYIDGDTSKIREILGEKE